MNPGAEIPFTPLHSFACNGLMLDVRMMEEKLKRDPKLINARCLVKERDGERYDYTPLHSATKAGHLRCLVFLLQRDPSRKETADVNATYGPSALNALSLTMDSSCINMLLLNGIKPDYDAPSYLGLIEFPSTLYVNSACQCNNPLAVAALLEHGAATLDEQFVDWQLANDNTDAIFEEVPLCIACEVGAVECVRLLLLHKADTSVVFRLDATKTPLADHCLDRVINCCNLNNGLEIMRTLHAFGVNFGESSAMIRRNSQQSELSSDFTRRALITEYLRLAKERLSENAQRRLKMLRKYDSLSSYKKFVSDVLLKATETKEPMGVKEIGQKREKAQQFLLFQDMATK
ncbi:Hypothetical predicted protein [Cloeon dipterum]|uniref:SOCS box domain-containing protein n=1 Tax=Cloeon dipterum TaxID=197152 RepID=A0A8S1CSF5_9INSE|nr:Hypothetical predicted protein [Cloeon dipterum]